MPLLHSGIVLIKKYTVCSAVYRLLGSSGISGSYNKVTGAGLVLCLIYEEEVEAEQWCVTNRQLLLEPAVT